MWWRLIIDEAAKKSEAALIASFFPETPFNLDIGIGDAIVPKAAFLFL
jgi:hypothetical protein